MSVEILTVSLSDESIEKLAQRLWEIGTGNGAVTLSNPPSPQTPQGAEQPGFQQGPPPSQNSAPDPWTQPQAPQQQYQQPAQQAQPQQGQVPTCAHGPKRWVPPGFSQNTGKSYPGFYACPAPRGQQCPR